LVDLRCGPIPPSTSAIHSSVRLGSCGIGEKKHRHLERAEALEGGTIVASEGRMSIPASTSASIGAARASSFEWMTSTLP
jgi:hypothetical protein